MASEPPDKYTYVPNFLQNSESFWIQFDLCLKLSFHAEKNSKFLKMALSEKVKFKNQKFEKFS